MKACEILISAPWTLPIAPQNIALEDHCLAITNGAIVDLGPRAKLHQDYQANEVIELAHHILLPGLINAHGHAAMTLLRGAGEDQSLQAWLNETIWPLEAKLVSPEFVQLGTEFAICEMLLSGTTTFSDMYFFPEAAAQACVNAGIRSQLAFPLIEFANAWSTSAADAIAKGTALHGEFQNNDLINIAFGPHSAYSLNTPELERIARRADELDMNIQIHLHETADEVSHALGEHDQSWVTRLQDIGFLGANVQAVHMTQATQEEVELIATADTGVVHCPTSNLKLASGYCSVAQFQDAGVCVALGTDGAASNNRLDMFDEARMAALLAKHHEQDAAAGNAPATLRMATLDGAKVLGIEHLTGSLEVGKRADVISVDTTALGMLPLYNPFAALIHGNAGNAVSDVFVDGRGLVRNGALTQMSQPELAQRVQSWHARLS